MHMGSSVYLLFHCFSRDWEDDMTVGAVCFISDSQKRLQGGMKVLGAKGIWSKSEITDLGIDR